MLEAYPPSWEGIERLRLININTWFEESRAWAGGTVFVESEATQHAPQGLLFLRPERLRPVGPPSYATRRQPALLRYW